MAITQHDDMSVVEDVRKVIQDFLAPQLRELSARMESLEKVVEAKFEAQDAKFESLAKQLEGISDKLDLDRRLTKLESQQVSASAKTAWNLHFDLNYFVVE